MKDNADRYRKLGARIGPGCRIHGTIDTVNPHLVTIEDHVVLAHGSHIITHCPVDSGPVHIGHHAFIGYGAIILPNVSIGKCALIGAGGVVTKDVQPYAKAAGNPAKVIGQRLIDELASVIEALEEGLSIGETAKTVIAPTCKPWHGVLSRRARLPTSCMDKRGR